MIKWSDKLYVHSELDIYVTDIMEDLFKKSNYNIYCIIKALDGRNLYEIMSVSELYNRIHNIKLYNNKQIEILGIARGKKNIKEVLVDIVEAEFCK